MASVMMMTDSLEYFGAIISISFWVLIWIMHMCAITNAKLKLNKTNNATNQLHYVNSISNNNNNNHNDKTNKYSFINLPLPGVSIIKPLVGLDRNLSKNLETFFTMDYPTYELMFCVQDPQDAAIIIVESLFKKYPQADAKLFIGGRQVGVNPKINNMQPAYESTKYELILISDSGISMKPDTLLDMVAHMHDNVALVHQMPFVLSSNDNNYDDNNNNNNNNSDQNNSSHSHHNHNHHHQHHPNTTRRKNFVNKPKCNKTNGGADFKSVLERVYFGTAHARAYLTADLLNINCPTGMSALMRKCLLDEVGGIKAFGSYLAEDYFFAKSFTDRGWKISISSQPAQQNSANSCDIMILSSRIQRWIKLRFAMVPQWTILEPFSECMLLGLIGAISISFLWALNAYVIFTLHVLTWFIFDYKLLSTIQNGPITFSKTYFLIAWLLRECSAPIIFILALTDPKVTWRSRKFKLKWGGYAEEVSSSSLSSTPLPEKDIIDNKDHTKLITKNNKDNNETTTIADNCNNLISNQFSNTNHSDLCLKEGTSSSVLAPTISVDEQIIKPAYYLGYNYMYLPFLDLVN